MCVAGHICEGERALPRSRHPIKVCSPYVCLLMSIKQHMKAAEPEPARCENEQRLVCAGRSQRLGTASPGMSSQHHGRAPACPAWHSSIRSAINPAARSPSVTATTHTTTPLTHCLTQKKRENVRAKPNRFPPPGPCLLCFCSEVSPLPRSRNPFSLDHRVL